jgi:hypothetical protein
MFLQISLGSGNGNPSLRIAELHCIEIQIADRLQNLVPISFQVRKGLRKFDAQIKRLLLLMPQHSLRKSRTSSERSMN